MSCDTRVAREPARLERVTVAIFAGLAGFVLGAAVVWALRERDCSVLRSQVTAAETRLTAEQEALQRERVGLQETMIAQFQEIAGRTLGSVSETFLGLATTKLGEEREALQGIVRPVREEFVKFERAVNELREKSSSDLGSLKTSLEQVARLQTSLQEAVRTTNDATGQLRTALQNPRIAGSWGELSLERIIEYAGMTEHCNFDRQTGVTSIDGSSERPDILIKLTGGLCIPVDSKASATNFIRAIGEGNLGERERLLKLSARDLRQRITELRGRGYDRIAGYAGMTFLFCPSEAMLSSALTLEPDMIEEGLKHCIVVCSPLLLICYLRAFAHGWSLQKQQENAEEVARLGVTLHERIRKFFVSLNDTGVALRRVVGKFNEVIAKTDNLLVPGRELGKLLGTNRELSTTNAIDASVRDIALHGSTMIPGGIDSGVVEGEV